MFKYIDDLGPEKILHVYDPKTGLKGILVVDNTACGPAMGGVRMAPDVSTNEVCRLARAMTLKNAAAEIPFGGGKGGIIGEPTAANKSEIIKAFAKSIKTIIEYIPAPDMGTDEGCMAIIFNEIGRACSLPRELGGLPIDEMGAAGYGVVCSSEVACKYVGLDLNSATVAIEGFGAVGKAVFKFMREKGAKIVSVSDINGATYNPEGLNYEKLVEVSKSSGSVKYYSEDKNIENEELFELPVDILIPGARPDAITVKNVHKIQAKLLVEAANIPVTLEAEKILHKRGILVVPDFIANAGGAITVAVELGRGTEKEAYKSIEEKIKRNTKRVLDEVKEKKILPRTAANNIARESVLRAMRYTGRL